MSKSLFVYGTLGPGRPNEHILKSIGGAFEEASVTGFLHNRGWGSEFGYPGITLDAKGVEVEGFLFCSDNLSGHWSHLDEFEGDGYERILTDVKTKNNFIVKAFIYILKKGNAN